MPQSLVRTTVTIPKPLLQAAHHYAIRHQTSVSRLVRIGLQNQIKQSFPAKIPAKSILDLAGSLKLGGKRMPSRDQLYDD